MPVSKPSRPWVTMVVATSGYGITYFAWTLTGPIGLGPSLWPGLTDQKLMLLATVAALVGSIGRLPVGVLTDRHGGRLVLPILCALVAFPVLGLAAVDPGLPLALAAVAIGIAGMTFSAGAAVVIRAYPRAWRGLALSAFSAGQGLAVAAGMTARPVYDREQTLPLLALALVIYAVVAAALLRDRPEGQVPAGWRTALDVARTPAARQLVSWYAVAHGGTIAIFLYLEAYLHQAYGLPRHTAALYTAACLIVIALGRPLGGWLCQHRQPVFLLWVCFLGAGALVLVLAFQPVLLAVVVVVLTVSGFLGVAFGVVMALVGATAPRARAGTVAGVVSAIGGLVGLGPPLLLATAYGVNGTYGIGLALLAGAALTGAVVLRLRGRRLGTALAFPASIAPGNEGMVVVAVSTPPIGTQLAQTMASLTTLANHQELLIVAGGADRLTGYELVVALRTHLPRHRIVAVAVGELPHHHELGVMVDLLNEGALPVVLSGQARPDGVAFVVADALGARRVLTVTRDRVDGVILRPPWAPLPATADC